MNCNNWEKYTDVIQRLSSRIQNKQNQTTMVDNCDIMSPLCVEKSFYQCKSNIGQQCCVEVCANCSNPIKLSGGFKTNININTCRQSICNTKINQQCLNQIGSNRHQFTISKIFDNKRKYIDYVVTNVLRQVVNHIPLDCLYQLSCCLPQNIEEILCNVTDIDSDHLVRILVTEVLQCYSTNAGQLTDWYAFANSIKPLLPSPNTKNGDNAIVNDTENKIPSKSKKSIKKKKSSEDLLENRVKSIFDSSSIPSFANKKESSENISFNKISSINRTSSNETASQIISTTNRMTPRKTRSKETFTPIGTKYQSKTKPNQKFILDKIDKINHHESLPFREKITNQSTLNKFQLLPDSHHHDQKSNKSSDQSLSSDYVLTIHHKHKHKKAYNHSHHTTTSFDIPSLHSLSSNNSVLNKNFNQKYKQTSTDTSSLIIDSVPTCVKSQQTINLNPTNTEQLKQSDRLTDKQILLFNLFSSSDNAKKYLNQLENPSSQLSSTTNEHEISHLINEVTVHPYSVADNHQLSSSTDLNKSDISSNNNPVCSNTDSVALEKKILRINYYPNMLADFD